MNETTCGMIKALQSMRVRGGINEPTTRQKDGELTLARTYVRVVGGDERIEVEPPCGIPGKRIKRVRDDWADK